MVAGRFRHWVNRLQTLTRETGRLPEDWHRELTWKSSPPCKVLVAATEGWALSGRQLGEVAGGATGVLKSCERAGEQEGEAGITQEIKQHTVWPWRKGVGRQMPASGVGV